jgi:hypothetical protein
LLSKIVNKLVDDPIEINRGDSKARCIANNRKLLNELRMNNKFSLRYHFSEDELYEAKSDFILEFLKHIRKIYKNKIM